MESNEEKKAASNGWVPEIKMRLPESAGPGCDLSPSDLERARSMSDSLANYLSNTCYGRSNFTRMYYEPEFAKYVPDILHDAAAKKLMDECRHHQDDPAWKHAFGDPKKAEDFCDSFGRAVLIRMSEMTLKNENDAYESHRDCVIQLSQCVRPELSDFVENMVTPFDEQRRTAEGFFIGFFNEFEDLDEETPLTDAICDYSATEGLYMNCDLYPLVELCGDEIGDAFGDGAPDLPSAIHFGVDGAVRNSLFEHLDLVKYNLAANAVNRLGEDKQENLLKAYGGSRGQSLIQEARSPLALELKEVTDSIPDDEFTPATPKKVADMLLGKARRKLGKENINSKGNSAAQEGPAGGRGGRS